MSRFAVGNKVRFVDDAGSGCINKSLLLTLGKIYEVSEVCYGGYQYIKLTGYEKLGWWHNSRFEKVPSEKKINPEYVEDLQRQLQAYRDAIRPALPEHLEHSIIADDVTQVVQKYQRMERALFLAEHYNWNRVGLTWEQAARDMLNYVRYGLGLPSLAPENELIPHKPVYFATATLYIGGKKIEQAHEISFRPLSPFSIGSSKPADNNCPDKLEPCIGCAEGCSHPTHKR